MTTGNPFIHGQGGYTFPNTLEEIDALRDKVIAYIAETTARSHGLPVVLDMLDELEKFRARKAEKYAA